MGSFRSAATGAYGWRRAADAPKPTDGRSACSDDAATGLPRGGCCSARLFGVRAREAASSTLGCRPKHRRSTSVPKAVPVGEGIQASPRERESDVLTTRRFSSDPRALDWRRGAGERIGRALAKRLSSWHPGHSSFRRGGAAWLSPSLDAAYPMLLPDLSVGCQPCPRSF